MLNSKLAVADSMTHDVMRDLLGVKLDMNNYAVILITYISLLENVRTKGHFLFFSSLVWPDNSPMFLFGLCGLPHQNLLDNPQLQMLMEMARLHNVDAQFKVNLVRI